MTSTERQPANESERYDQSRWREYATELDAASDILTRVIGHGAGRLTVAGHLARLFPAADAEPADAVWAEAAGFRWSADGTAMVRKVGPFEVLLSGDLIHCERDRHLSILWPCPYEHEAVGEVTKHYGISDNPTVGEVRLLFDALGQPLTEGR